MKYSKIILIGALFGILFSITSCSNNKSRENKTASQQEAEKSLNISIFLDLSDRLTRQMTPSQMSRDTAIVAYIADCFKAKTLGPQILTSKNSIKIFFYPTPSNPNIATLADGLHLDVSTKKGVEKRNGLERLRPLFKTNLSAIYSKTLSEHNWIGCDIWDFFSSKKVDSQCIKANARNILFILTDGYVYAENNKIKEGKAYSYILPQTLSVEGSSLLATRKGLDNLEVMVLEVNPYTKEQGYKMIPILEKWFKDMGVKKVDIAETDLPINTQTIIKQFLEE
jgi:hypothetical protein